MFFSDDYVKIIHNEGMPDVNDPTVRGDIIIKFDIVYPIYSPFADQTICEMFNDDDNNNNNNNNS
jgi:DnaJ-class molecular chaperone